MKSNLFLLLSLCFLWSSAYSEMETFQYSRALNGIDQQWHKIILPPDVQAQSKRNLSDIRIFGVKENGDIIEAPYVLRRLAKNVSRVPVAFKQINSAHNDQGYFYTFELPTVTPINQIDLNFGTPNFDWRVKLEGSFDQTNWFILKDDYRILSIKNEQADYQMTRLDFSEKEYQFFRVQIKTKADPKLLSASIQLEEIRQGNYDEFPIKQFLSTENKDRKRTEISIDFGAPVPISQLQFVVDSPLDYYRKIKIKGLRDSVKTDKGWRYNYTNLASGSISSLSDNEFDFTSFLTQKIQVEIFNQDNNPLPIKSVIAKGYSHELQARFSEPASYFLSYGNKRIGAPNYDIKRFTSNIPKELSSLTLGEVKKTAQARDKTAEPLFENKAWLWGIMILIIGLLGWFSLRMLRE